jgi:hypothetical protein
MKRATTGTSSWRRAAGARRVCALDLGRVEQPERLGLQSTKGITYLVTTTESARPISVESAAKEVG